MTGKVVRLVGIAGAALLLVAGPVSAGQAEGQKTAKPNDNYDVLFQQYLASARTTPVNGPDSLWMAGLFGDLRARRVNDLLTINVMESVSAQGSADSSLDKSSSGKAGVSSFWRREQGSELPQPCQPGDVRDRHVLQGRRTGRARAPCRR